MKSDRISLREILRITFSVDITRNALFTAFVVGTALNLVNQGARWLNGEGVLIGNLLLNYFMPYSVASYSAVRTRLQDIRSKVYQESAGDSESAQSS